MPATKLMVIRHAEKPPEFGAGVDDKGAPNDNALAVQGWQRAGALVRFFAPLTAPPAAGILQPGKLFAAQATAAIPSLRPQNTVTPLAAALKLDIDTTYTEHQEKELAAAAQAAEAATVLIAWHHGHIPKIAEHLAIVSGSVPAAWDPARFDLVWVFDKQPDGWAFSIVPQRLLPGDLGSGA